jgi:DNA-binding CsgD family transcriptional regulator
LARLQSLAELARHARAAADVAEFQPYLLDAFRRVVSCDRIAFKPGSADAGSRALDVFEVIKRWEVTRSESTGQGIRALLLLPATGELWTVNAETQETRLAPVVHGLRSQTGLGSALVLLPTSRGGKLGTIVVERSGGEAFSAQEIAAALELLPIVELALSTLPTAPENAPLALLSTRETEIAHHVERGLTTNQIALVLGTSPFTVRNQISKIFDKTRTASRAELAALVARSQTPSPAAAGMGR